MAYGTPPPVLPSAQNQDTGLSINIANGNANKVPADAATLPEVTVTASPLAKPDVVGNLTASDEIVAQPNVLDRFASYTYSASVYLMSTLQCTCQQRWVPRQRLWYCKRPRPKC